MQIIAHRGAKTERPEHTMPAYELALEQGADGVECDIRLTKDNQLVCVHDATLARVTSHHDVPDTRAVAELRYDELRTVNLGTEDAPAYPLLFTDLLELVREHDVGFFIETKHPLPQGAELERALHETLVRFNMTMDPRLHLISFSPKSLWDMKRLNPHLHRIYLREQASSYTLREVERYGTVAAHAVEPALFASGVAQGFGPDINDAKQRPHICRKGDSLYMWTANTESDVRWALRHGVKWLATDVPAAARTWLDGASRL